MKDLFLTVICVLFIPFAMCMKVNAADHESKSIEFNLVSKNAKATLYIDSNDYLVVHRAAQMFSGDVCRITGDSLPIAYSSQKLTANCIIAGTIGHHALIDRLVKQKRIQVQELEGRWESYQMEVVRHPFPGVDKALIIVGSDRRGTAYGLLSVSEDLGVSPWYWWADVPVPVRKDLKLCVKKSVSQEPSVRYRGLFINDEDWGLLRWAKNTFEPQRGNIGPRTYAKVCELLLRLKANYLCPAMHEASTAFNQIPENKLVADTFGIVMGSVHCEPLLFNNASEWDKKTMGEWDYESNREGINRVLRRRVEENSAYENVYTLALRGLHDKAMGGSNDMKERAKMLSKALQDQRQIVVDVLGKPADQIPQAFTPYKEVLDVYDAGLDLPDDVTIIWPDDNYGYLKRLSSPREQLRSGRSGVYYHASYLGKPHDYLWMSTNPPALMYEELRKAYDTTADRIWLLNAGDIKGCESAVDLFLAMAYDINQFNYDNVSSFQADQIARWLGDVYYDDLLFITQTFYRLAFARKPELMGWGYQWTTNKRGKEQNTDTDFSFSNYREAERRIEAYQQIGAVAEQILAQLPEEKYAAFYQLVYYPIKGCELLNKMILEGQRNRWYALQQRASTKDIEERSRRAYDSLQVITQGYNSLLNGKWNHVMTTRQGFAASYFELPRFEESHLNHQPKLGIWVENEDVLKCKSSYHLLPMFNTYFRHSQFFEIYNKGIGLLDYHLQPSAEWIKLSEKQGTTLTDVRIAVDIDWGLVPVGEAVSGHVTVKSNCGEEQILVSVFNPAVPECMEMDSLFVEHNGYVSIDAARYHRIVENEQIQIRTVPGIGYEGAGIQFGNPVAPPQKTANSTVPRAEYDFYSFSQGAVDVYTYVLPTFTLSADRTYAGHESTNIETRYGVCIDEGPVMNPSTSSFEYAQIWYESVLRNCRINKTTLHVERPGKHTLKVLCGDAGTVIQKVVLDFGGLQHSYQGPQPTRK